MHYELSELIVKCVFKTQRFVLSKRCVMTLRWQRSVMTLRFDGVLSLGLACQKDVHLRIEKPMFTVDVALMKGRNGRNYVSFAIHSSSKVA